MFRGEHQIIAATETFAVPGECYYMNVGIKIGALDTPLGLGRSAAARLKMDRDRLALDDVALALNGGQASGRLNLRRDNAQTTASGALYDQEGWTCASRDLPFGTMLLVGHAGRKVLLLVNDRGPYVADRVLDLSHAAAQALGVRLGPVDAQVVVPS